MVASAASRRECFVPWQRNSDVLEIKARARRRDGNRCVVCKLDGASHEKQRGRILDVHRIVPGSRYSTDFGVCATVCEICHGAIHGKGHWGWTATKDSDNEWQMKSLAKQSWYQDRDEEASWRARAPWGAWVKELRVARQGVLFPLETLSPTVRRRKRNPLIKRFADRAGLAVKDLLDFEAGRREPVLREAKKLAAVLGITTDELATEKQADDVWRAACEQRSDRRALIFRAREAREGEIEFLGRSAKLLWELVGRVDATRAEEREAVRQAQEDYRLKMAEKHRSILSALKATKSLRPQ